MLLVQENIVKLGGVILSGQCKKISIDETATIENIEDDKGKTKQHSRQDMKQQRSVLILYWKILQK